MSFDKYVLVVETPHPNQDVKYFHDPCFLCVFLQSIFYLHLHLPATINLLSVPIVLPFPEISYKWNDSVGGLLYLSSSAWHKAFETHPGCINSLFLFIAEKYFIVWTTVRLFPFISETMYLGCFWFGAITKAKTKKKTAVNIHIQVFEWAYIFSWVNT